jgi:PAS domain S-box-containing protein
VPATQVHFFRPQEPRVSSAPRHRLSHLAAAVESSEDAIIGTDSKGTITGWNPGAKRLYGYVAEEVIGKPVSILIPADHSSDFPDIMQKIRRGENVAHYETVRKKKDGTLVEVSLSVSPILDKVGNLVAASTIARNISERKQAQQALEKSEEKFSKAFRHSPIPIVLTSTKDHRYIEVNESFEQLSGWRRDELIGRTPYELSILAERPRPIDNLLRGVNTVRDMEVRFRRKDGSERIALASAELLEVGNELCILSVIADITSRKEAEHALAETNKTLQHRTALLESREQLLKIFVQYVPAAVAMLDRDMRYLQVSDRWCADYALDSAQIIGRSHYEVFPDVPDRWREMHRRGLNGETLRAEEDRWDRQPGPNWLRWEIRPWNNTEGQPGGILIFAEDITRHKEMEESLSTVNRRLIEAQEQERARIGRELHDDINQRLAMLAIELQQLQDHPADLGRRLQELRKHTIEISNDVQALSHEFHPSKLEYLGVVAGIKSWCREFGKRQRIEIEFQSNVAGILPPNVGVCLFRILQEALHNAVKYSGTKRVEVEIAEHSNEVQLIVRDSGTGFDTEAARHGRGLGLTSMKERVRLLGGTITIESRPKGGTTIHVEVPFESAHKAQQASG